MFNIKSLLTKKTSTIKIPYTAFSQNIITDVDNNLMPHKYSVMSYNFEDKNGALSTGNGFKILTLPTGIGTDRELIYPPNVKLTAVWFFKHYDFNINEQKDVLIFLGENMKLYWCLVETQMRSVSNLIANVFGSKPNVLNYRLNGEDVCLISSADDFLRIYRPAVGATEVANGPKLISMCMHNERGFAIEEGERTRLLFSQTFDPTNWTASLEAGGFIDMLDERGRMNKVVSFNNYVYIFRDFGISRVSAFGDQEDFTVSHLFNSSHKIYGDSVSVCGDKILFLTTDGLYTFDGSSTKKIDLGFENIFSESNSKCVSAFHDSKYYLACKLNFNDNENIGSENNATWDNNALLEIDLENYNANIMRGVDISCLTALKSEICPKLIATFSNQTGSYVGELTKNGKIMTENTTKRWYSPKSNLGYANRKKIIKEIILKCDGDATIKLITDKESKSYNISQSDTTQRIKTNVKGELVQIVFETNEDNIFISAPELIVSIV